MEDKGSIILKGKRITLRPLKQGDEVAMYKNWVTSDQVTKYLTWTPHTTIKKTIWLLNMWIEEYQDLSTYRYGIVLDNDEVIGMIDVVRRDDENKKVEIGYCLGEAFWNQGIMSEALDLMIKHLFDCGYELIESCHHVDNPASGKVMKKCKMIYQGVVKGEHFNNQGQPVDVDVYAIRREL